jgi:primosomal protein N' (replication factor Y) (superfamily II helicase)
MKIARIAIDVPVNTLFDYLSSDVSAVDIGRLTLVPFGRKTTVGVIVEIAEQSGIPSPRLKNVLRVLRDAPALSGDDLDLLKFAAAYYHYSIGATIMSAVPALLRQIGAPSPIGAATYGLTASGEAVAINDLPSRALTQRRVLALIKESRSVDRATIRNISPSAFSALKQLIANGWITTIQPSMETVRPPVEHVASAGPALTDEQLAAARAIQSKIAQFAPFVLLGVTSSGKTEVYLQAIDTVLRSRRQTLLLVPEIALTPQLEGTIRSRFPAAPLVALHSGLNERERLQRWLAAQSGNARIVVGTRLAVFAPMPELGLIIVDEEHDASLKQSDALRYSARDLAVVRAQQRNVPIVLGSATPALETYQNAVTGRYRLLTLTRRISASAPRIESVNTRGERLVDGLSRRLLDAIAVRLERKLQSLIFINRRGFAPVLLCRACGWLSECHRCSANLVLHLDQRRLHCHHCGYQAPVPTACPQCGNQELGPVGHGTQRLEAALGQCFPTARILRIDRDSTRRKLAWPGMRRQIENREVDILVGTQILAKGHDFAHLNLVGVVNADSLLYNTDLRASERLYALLTQVAGRAGRGDVAGEVLIQTEFPNHPLYLALQNQDYASFAGSLLEERQQAGFPPYVYQALLRAEAPRIDAALAYLAHAAAIGRTLSEHVTLYDPVPATMMRRAGRERAQLLAQAESRSLLQRFLAAWHTRLSTEQSSPARWSLDVDPLEF